MKTSMNLKTAGTDIVRNPSKPSVYHTKENSKVYTSHNQSMLSDHSTVNLSKIQYKNGTILKDASNPNPGFGLWCINTGSEHTQMKNAIKEALSEYDFPEKDEVVDTMDKLLIDKLKFKCNDLEKKYADALSKFYEKENQCLNMERMQKEYEEIVNDNIEQRKMLQAQNKQYEEYIGNLTIALGNAHKEIARLNQVINDNQKYVQKINEENEEKIKVEIRKQDDLKKQMYLLEQQLEEIHKNTESDKEKNNKKIINPNFKVKSSNTESSIARKMEYQVKTMSDLVLNLQIEISNLKKKIITLEDDKNTLKEIIKFKDKKNKYQKQNIDNLCSVMEEKDREHQWTKHLIKEKNEVISTLRLKNNEITRTLFNNNQTTNGYKSS